MRNKILVSLALALGGLFVYQAVMAVGGGGGGSAPACSEDVWTCGDWSSCSADGKQTRICQLSYDCPSVQSAVPPQERSCTPPAPPPAASPAFGSPSPAESPAPQTTKPSSATPECKEDQWTCTDWSKTCDINGNQSRACRLTFDCPAANTPPPLQQQRCDHLQCGNKSELRERVFCRLNLAPAGIARELELQYLPEECRVLGSAKDKESCEERYKSYQPCWGLPAGEGRFECARNVLKLGPAISDELKTCQGKTGAARVSCVNEAKDKVFSMIKFRFYDLEQRAEKLGERGADLTAVADLETLIELKKRDFDRARSFAERKQMILDVRQAWQAFISKVKNQVK